MIAPWAASYVGIPFQTGGATRAGCDCWGLAIMAYREVFGIDLLSYAAEYDSLNCRVLAQVVAGHLPVSPWRQVPTAEMAIGDGLLFRVVGQPVHVGLFVGDGRFLHAPAPRDEGRTDGIESCIDRLESPRWARRLLGVYRYGG